VSAADRASEAPRAARFRGASPRTPVGPDRASVRGRRVLGPRPPGARIGGHELKPGPSQLWRERRPRNVGEVASGARVVVLMEAQAESRRPVR
jgi:hypothetical protein